MTNASEVDIRMARDGDAQPVSRPLLRAVSNSGPGPREVVVQRQWRVGSDVKAIELVAADGGTLPAAAAGAHLDVHLPDGTVRQYSITNPAPAPASYRIGVLRDPNSRGGSRYMVEQLQDGEHLSITGPRNHFELDEAAVGYRLIAGGIGVTPLLAMARRLVEMGAAVEFHYLVRQRERAAFLDELSSLLPEDALHLHVDEEDGRADLHAILGDGRSSHQVYTCGPEPLLAAIREATTEWPQGRVRFERFRLADADQLTAAAGAEQACRVELKQSGIEFELQPDETLLEALERQDLDPPCLCREGVCGTCAVGVLEGEVDHRDALQDDAEKAQNDVMYVCVSRPLGPRLVLDI